MMFIYFFCLLWSTQFISGQQVWEFGSDVKGSAMLAQYSGEISIFEKTKHIKIYQPTCWDVVYVRVLVENRLSTPAVAYDKVGMTVVISYKLLQSSWSSYFITAMGIRKKGCFND